jgi:AI-2 transport protein TqsA
VPDHGTRSSRLSFDALLRVVLLVAGACIIIASLRAASVVLVPLMVALFITAVGAAPVFWLTQRRVPYWIAVAVVGFATAGLLVALVFLVLHWQEAFVERLPLYRDRMEVSVEALRSWLNDVGLSRTVDEALESTRGGWFVPASTRSFQILSATVFVLVLVGFLLVELTGMPIKLRASYGPADPRTAAIHATAVRLMGYFRIKTVSSLATGLVAGVTCWLVGVDYPVLWGLVAFFFNYAPTVGSVVAAVPPIFLAWLMLGWEQAAVVGVAYLAINIIIGAIIEPKLLGDHMNLSPLAVLLSLLFWGWVWGAGGVILAVPITMVLKNGLASAGGMRTLGLMLGSTKAAKAAIDAERNEHDD